MPYGVCHIATSCSPLPRNPRAISPALSRQLTCIIYSACNSTSLDQLWTSSLHHRCLGPAALLQLPLSAVPVYIVYPIVHTCYNLVHIYACTSARAPHLACTSSRMHLISRAPLCMHHTSRTSPHAHLCVHLCACTSSRVHLYACTSSHVHLYACTSAHAPLRVHLCACTSAHAPHLACTSTRAPLVHHLHSCTNQPRAPIKPIRHQDGPGPFR